MAILYACISRGTTILCSHGKQVGSSNYEQAAMSVLPNIPTRNDGKTTISASSCKFHCLVENGIIYMCASTDSQAQPCYAFLTEIKDQFHDSNLAMRAMVGAQSHAFDAEFNNVIAKQMEKSEKPDGVAVLQSQVHEVKGVMAQNIEKVIERGERLDDLIDKTDELEAASATFQKTAAKIKKKYWWRNTKMKIILACVVFVIITGIVLAIVFGTGVLDSSSSDKKPTAAPPATTTHSR